MSDAPLDTSPACILEFLGMSVGSETRSVSYRIRIRGSVERDAVVALAANAAVAAAAGVKEGWECK